MTRWAAMAFLALGLTILAFWVNGYVQTGMHLGWRVPQEWLIYAGVPLVELALVAFVAIRASSRMNNTLALVWILDVANLAASVGGVFGAY